MELKPTYSDTLVTLGLSQAIAAAAIEGYLAAGGPPAGAPAFGQQVADAGPVGGSGLAYVGLPSEFVLLME